nr:type VII secretion target [Haloglycomyces albus]
MEVEECRSAAQNFNSMSSDFGMVADYANDEEGDVTVFGVIGTPLATQYYQCADSVQSLMEKLESAGAGLGRLIDNSCTRYENADEKSAQALRQAREI